MTEYMHPEYMSSIQWVIFTLPMIKLTRDKQIIKR